MPRSPACAITPGTVGYSDVAPHAGARLDFEQYVFQSGPYCLIIHSVRWYVAAEPSERTTGTICWLGSFNAGLSAAIAGSFHVVIARVKIFTMFSPDSRRFVTRCPLIERLYMNTVPPAVIGMYA